MSREHRTILIQVLLFIVTFITTTIAGSEWCYNKLVYSGHYSWNDFASGLQFSIPFLLILTAHEFGHYFTARYHKVKSSLPYYIPFPPIPFSIGTMGAVIRLRSRVPSTRKNFDIGIAGPIAGFVVALVILLYGFTHLPPADYSTQIHEQFKVDNPEFANVETIDVTVGKNLLFLFFEKFIADPSRVPTVHEMMHYPLLFAGFLALVFTSLNLLPIGQLDGGHVLYGLAGFKRHRIVASIFFVGFIFYAGLGFEYVLPSQPASTLLWTVPAYGLFLYSCFTGLKLSVRDTIMYAALVFAAQYIVILVAPGVTGYPGWLLFGFLIGRVLGIPHPPSDIEEPLDQKRKILGWIALAIFILSFTPSPINFQ
jgi:membrane-associated protease RseP (regulator of RpoE activity)